ncbi:MAG: sirohydrochlorin cobaltochelatase [Oscillospiraceae bacterium]|nr:sirohydrochlorin cobaltochelatase [Oscillospiraceae bacterium]
MDSPLLAGPKIDFVADMLVEEAASFKEEVIVYVGHGTHGRDPRGPAAYRKLQELIHDRGNGNTFIGELQTGIEPVIRELSEKAFRRIRLCSLMMVSGHHWIEDVAGDKEDSWRNVLAEAGYEVTCARTGLLERREVREILLGGTEKPSFPCFFE